VPSPADLSDIAREAGALALRRWRGAVESTVKADGSIVCAVDHEVDALLKIRLRALDPLAGWLSEETADNAERLLSPRVWIVDPIDGTRDFVRGQSGWAVSIAYAEGGRVTMGVLDAPARDEHWRATVGGGAYRNDLAVSCAHRTSLAGARVPADALVAVDADLTLVPKPNSIALRMAMVAAGEADLLASIRWGHEWDVAAAALVAQEGGAMVTDAFGHPLRFNSTKGEAFGVLAASPGIHAAAVERLAARAAATVRR
jgi:myo-inositol-1(or 4)-monophosphatase